MNPNIRIDESFVSNILQKGGWDKLDIDVASVETEEEVIEEAKKKVKDLGEPGEENDTVAEAKEHVCPLCESKLEEELTDEQLVEHAEVMAGILEGLEVIEEEEDSEEEAEEEEDDEDEEKE